MNTVRPVLEIENVSFSYGCHPVLEGISLSVKPGESVGITGPNGAGKSTLLKLVVGLLMPASGSIRLFGRPLKISRTRKVELCFPEGRFHQWQLSSTVERSFWPGALPAGTLRYFNREDHSLPGRLWGGRHG